MWLQGLVRAPEENWLKWNVHGQDQDIGQKETREYSNEIMDDFVQDTIESRLLSVTKLTEVSFHEEDET